MKRGALVIVVAACWHAQPDVVAPHAAPPPHDPQTYSVVHHAAARVPASDFEEAMMRISDFTEEMCRCSDQPCTQTVMNDITRWGTEWQQQHPDFRATEDENRQIQEIATTLMECMQKATTNGVPTSP